MDCLSVLNPSRLFISSLNISLSFSFLFPFFFFFISPFSTHHSHFLFLSLRCGCMRSLNWLILHLFHLIGTNRSIIVIVGLRTKRWILPSLLNSRSISLLQTSNGWYNGDTSRPWLVAISRKTMYLWSDFVIAFIIPHVVLHDNLAAIVGYLVAIP